MKNKSFICTKFATVKVVKRCLVFFAIILLLCQVPFSCAQRGRPEGGPKDTIPPVVLSTKPPNFSTDFNHSIIRIEFDEYIKLEDPDNQILISPPLKNKPIVKPIGQAMKYIEIELMDTLKKNTTYTVNFGKSIEDNNEGNPLLYYQYVFSTGDYIDSLSVSGTVKDAYNRETDEGISIMLYPLDSAYSDSIIYKEPPEYIAYTQDSTNSFSVEYARPGKYKMVALEDKNQNYQFNQKNEKIGFLTDTIELPTDKEYHLNIFREIRNYRVRRPEQVSLRNFYFGFEGRPDSTKIHWVSNQPEGFESAQYVQTDHDSISYWFKPEVDIDSVRFIAENQTRVDTFFVRYYPEMDKDSLTLEAEPTSSLAMNGDFRLSGNIPLQHLDTAQIRLWNKDSIQIPYQVEYQSQGNQYIFDFDKKSDETYHLRFLPGAVTDFYDHPNEDTLQYTLKTQSERNYADLDITLEGIDRFPVIVQLTDQKGKTKRELIHQEEEGKVFAFRFVEPGKYYVRVIYDDNDNGVWDTGSYLKHIQPEEVRYMPELLDVRKNWEIQQTFIME